MISNAEKKDISHLEDVSQKPFLSVLDAALLSRAAAESPFALGESYARGEWDSPHLDQLLYYVFSQRLAGSAWSHYGRILKYWLVDRLVNQQRGEGAFYIGKVHYDLGNELFQTMLDASMTYTCGYWKEAVTLEQAQQDKLELLCRKLMLRPGMHVLDIGCGWGNFARYAASHYGVSVTGVTISSNQADFARQTCAGLPVEILLKDYREISGTFDRVVSIEMIEAVGRRNLKSFFEVAARALKNQGLFVLEAISCETVSLRSELCLDQFLMWILKYIFPRGYLPKSCELADPARDLLVLEDLHNFGPDYDKTLLSWAANFDRGWPGLKNRYDESFYRIWRYYLLSCAAAFRARRVQLYQIVYSKGGLPRGYLAQR